MTVCPDSLGGPAEMLETKPVMVVAPAGNQGWNTLQYPAGFPSVIGVGSLMRDGKTKSAFSNYGPWVDCSTEGQHVISTFITGWANRQTEEKEPPNSSGVRLQPRKSFTSGWAAWSGTSFAAPKVAAAIANAKAGTSKTPAQAWDTVKKVFAGASAAKIAGMGIVMRALPPG